MSNPEDMVKEGYKEVNLGPKQLKIPHEWDIRRIKDIARNGRKTFIDGDWVESKDMVEDGEYQLIQLGNIGVGHFKGECNKFVPADFYNKNNCTLVEPGDLLISRMSDPILRTLITPTFDKKSITSVDIVIAKVDEENWDKRYIKYCLNYTIWRNIADSWATGSTRKRISRRYLEKIPLLYPPHLEQKKIAEILSTVDKAISQTDEIIEKTEFIKKGLMQNLLTKGIGYSSFKTVKIGPKEVEIPEEWKVVKLKSVAKIETGSTPSTKNQGYWNGNICWVTPTDITKNEEKYISDSKQKITELGLNNCSAKLLEPGAILMTSRATIGEACINSKPMATNQGFKSIVCEEKLHNEYFYYYIPLIKDYLKALAGGSTFLEISKKDMKNLRFPLPPINEQKRIASILSTIDEKNQNEKEYKQKLEEIKKGLMQDLLTGKKRVKVDNN